jgi:hypothetical protein
MANQIKQVKDLIRQSLDERNCYGCGNKISTNVYNQLEWEDKAEFCCIKTTLYILFVEVFGKAGVDETPKWRMHGVKTLIKKYNPPMQPIDCEWDCTCDNEARIFGGMNEKFHWQNPTKDCCNLKTINWISSFDEAKIPYNGNDNLNSTLNYIRGILSDMLDKDYDDGAKKEKINPDKHNPWPEY